MNADQAIDPLEFQGGLSHVLKGFITGLQETQAIFFYQLVVFAHHPSWLSAGMAALGAVVGVLIVNIIIFSRMVSSRRQLISCLDQMRNCTFTRYPASRFLDSPVHEMIDQSAFRRLLGSAGMVRAPLDDMVHVYVVEGPALIQQLSCYAGPSFIDSYIFITEPPQDTRGLRRFFVLHELGHSQMALFTHQSVFRLWMWPYIGFLLWFSLTGTWDRTTLLVGAAYLCVILLWSAEWKRHMASQRGLSEMLADCFALSYLSTRDFASVAGNQRLSVLLDRDMDELQNTTRLARLRENIELVRQGRGQAVVHRTLGAVQWPEWRSVLAGMGLVAIMGFTGAAPDAATARLIAVLAAGLMVWCTYAGVSLVLLEMKIEVRLNGRRTGRRTPFRRRAGSRAGEGWNPASIHRETPGDGQSMPSVALKPDSP